VIITDTLQATVLRVLLDTKLNSGVIIQHIAQDEAVKYCQQTLDDKKVIHMHIKDELLYTYLPEVINKGLQSSIEFIPVTNVKGYSSYVFVTLAESSIKYFLIQCREW
tara:strand:+ start:374 stop:697 length:324 start_codon:yes stop_codon:yes gene_type:complete